MRNGFEIQIALLDNKLKNIEESKSTSLTEKNETIRGLEKQL